MNFGFNSNVRVGEVTYHVQTEDRGPSHPFLDTVVYLSGRVVYKRSANYVKFANSVKAETLPQKLHELLARQHHAVIASLEAGTLPLPAGAKMRNAPPESSSPDGLELHLTNPKNCLTAGKAILEIELIEKHSKRRVGSAEVQAYLEFGKQHVQCAEGHTDSKGRATLQFPLPAKAALASSLVLRAKSGVSQAELRFGLKTKPHKKSPAPVKS